MSRGANLVQSPKFPAKCAGNSGLSRVAICPVRQTWYSHRSFRQSAPEIRDCPGLQYVPWGKPGTVTEVSGKVRRKFGTVPGCNMSREANLVQSPKFPAKCAGNSGLSRVAICPVGQTWYSHRSFRQSAPEIRDCPGLQYVPWGKPGTVTEVSGKVRRKFG